MRITKLVPEAFAFAGGDGTLLAGRPADNFGEESQGDECDADFVELESSVSAAAARSVGCYYLRTGSARQRASAPI